MADARETTAASSDDGRHSVSAAPPPAARGSATISVTIVLLVVLVASVAAFLMSPPASSSPDGKLRVEGAGGEGGRAGAELVEQAIGDGGIPGFNSRLDALRAWAKLTWMKLRRSHPDEPPRYDDTAGSATEAAKKSLEAGKETVEQAAARAVEGAVGKAKDKAKGAAAPTRTSSADAEL